MLLMVFIVGSLAGFTLCLTLISMALHSDKAAFQKAFGSILVPFRERDMALKEAKVQIRDLKGRLDSVLMALDYTGEGIVLIEEGLMVAWANKGALSLLGLQNHVVGKSLVYEIRDSRVIEAIESLLRGGNSGKKSKPAHTLEVSVQGRQLGLHASSLSSGLWVLYILDLTERKKLESIRSDFIANVAHELKTPITTINGFLETLLDGSLDDPITTKRFLMIAKRHTDRMDRLINELFLLSNIELGNVHMRIETYPILELVRETIEILQPLLLEKGLELDIRCEAGILVACDRDKVLQILINVVENAIKYTNKGKVTIEAEPQAKEGKVWVSVEDTGIGIPRSDLSRITERFYRVDKARSRALGGTGLGLAIVKHLLQLHNGELIIESDVGKGTRVVFSLPQADTSDRE
jgi:two-component system phosphate regulon sensor histidine kinase PhoR